LKAPAFLYRQFSQGFGKQRKRQRRPFHDFDKSAGERIATILALIKRLFAGFRRVENKRLCLDR